MIFLSLVLAAIVCRPAPGQAALLLQDADGIAAVMSPMGHESVYFARICAAGPMKLRRCDAGEPGAVISRYRGIGGYDWLAMPLIPYLYSVEDVSQVPASVNRETLQKLRIDYHDAHLMGLGTNVREGGGVRRGWDQLVGAAYERRIYAFRFETTAAEDDAFIAKMNDNPNRSHFNIFFGNCADFSRTVLNFYFPQGFGRHIVPDGGIVTPRQVAYELLHYARRHPEIRLTVLEIPLVRGVHHSSRVGDSAAESMVLTGYVVPIAILNPIAAGVIVADGLVWGRFPLPLKQAQVLKLGEMEQLAGGSGARASTPSSSGSSLDVTGGQNQIAKAPQQ